MEGLTRLKRKYIIAPLSNGNIALMTELAKFGRLPWDAILGAELVNHYKPDAETYRSAPYYLDLKPDEVMMCAAHISDLEAATCKACERASSTVRTNTVTRRATCPTKPGRAILTSLLQASSIWPNNSAPEITVPRSPVCGTRGRFHAWENDCHGDCSGRFSFLVLSIRLLKSVIRRSRSCRMSRLSALPARSRAGKNLTKYETVSTRVTINRTYITIG